MAIVVCPHDPTINTAVVVDHACWFRRLVLDWARRRGNPTVEKHRLAPHRRVVLVRWARREGRACHGGAMLIPGMKHETPEERAVSEINIFLAGNRQRRKVVRYIHIPTAAYKCGTYL